MTRLPLTTVHFGKGPAVEAAHAALEEGDHPVLALGASPRGIDEDAVVGEEFAEVGPRPFAGVDLIAAGDERLGMPRGLPLPEQSYPAPSSGRHQAAARYAPGA